MPRDRAYRVIALATLAAFSVSCASTHVAPISSFAENFHPDKDERRLWAQSRDEERKLRQAATIYHDPLLEEYLHGVVTRLNPPGMAANPEVSYSVTVVEDPALNAFAYPHGSLYIHTGMLARMENEDQIATVLAHEMTHVEDRHMLRYERSQRHRRLGLGIASVAGAVLVAGEAGRAAGQGKYGKAARIHVLSDIMLSLGLTLAIVASINGYGRRLEEEADEGGFAKMSAGGYDIREAEKVYEILKDDHGEQSKLETFFFGNHPRLSDRIASARRWASTHPEKAAQAKPTVPKAFQRRLRSVIRQDARDNIEARRFNLAEDELKRVLDQMPGDAAAHELMGQVKLAKARAAKDPDEKLRLEEEARSSFEEALRIDSSLPGPHRELGLLAYRDDEFARACKHLKRYLALAPGAQDAESIRDYLLDLRQDGHCD